MLTIDRGRSTLILVDYQSRLMPAIHLAPEVLANAKRLLDIAAMLDVPVVFTEQNPDGLGRTVPEFDVARHALAHKMTFDACRAPGFKEMLAHGHDLVVAGCEAHVCLLQTVLGLRDAGRKVYVVRDAVGARTAESKETALTRMARHGAEIVTTEMVAFEWLESAEHPRLRDVVRLVK
ncbi:MAG: isochorismatase family protein [Bradyrhizobiaceae bacterium]|nr:MAG: isochorismatase family protein [Bradyrhizobiaceae bacterium]